MSFIICTLFSCFPGFSPRLLREDIGNEGDKAFLSTVISDWTHFLDPMRALAITREFLAQCLDVVYLIVALLVIDCFEGIFYD